VEEEKRGHSKDAGYDHRKNVRQFLREEQVKLLAVADMEGIPSQRVE